MHKEIAWTSIKTTKDIEIINNIVLPQYDDILEQSYGYQILHCSNDYSMNHNFAKTRKKNNRHILCLRIRYIAS